ncbi:Wzz/FepE/Etk N-terminal domain-containing protein [Staphylococcus durrellii]|uniref:Wzz/FepE/Etk N-terminal domain-containing protein n=1 Tax=Staphylococcus durrellii TaxID=2781773 RepID=UPI00189FAB99|nr:Wzz/FepE/Etk N-terminal domain-containing protein [Staphylococcus durrellii]MBF7018006.1 capsule biosynthesis protein CapA [Staphylococcus durrellii]
MEKTLDLTKILNSLKKQWKLLIIIPIVFILISLLISFLMTPKYEASTQVLINQKESNKDYMAQEVQSNIQLVNTYKEIIKSPRIREEVAKENKEFGAGELGKMLKITNESDSQVLNIIVTSTSKKDSEKIANLFAKTVDKNMPDIMDIDNVSILSTANGTAKKVSPNIVPNILIALILGFLVALAIVLIRELLDQHIRTESDVEEELGLPVLGSIQKIK